MDQKFSVKKENSWALVVHLFNPRTQEQKTFFGFEKPKKEKKRKENR